MAAEGVEMLALIDSNSEATDTYEHYSKRGPDEHYDMLFVDASTPRSEQSSKRLSSRKVVKQKEPGWPYMTKMTDLIRPSTATPSSRVMGRPQSSRSVSSNISNVSSIYSTSSSEVAFFSLPPFCACFDDSLQAAKTTVARQDIAKASRGRLSYIAKSDPPSAD